MATEEQANAARLQHGGALLKRGVHAIGVEEGSAHGKPGWVVVAHVSLGAHLSLPETLQIQTPSGTGAVPLVVAHTEPFMPE